jgi:hypothetical protein
MQQYFVISKISRKVRAVMLQYNCKKYYIMLQFHCESIIISTGALSSCRLFIHIATSVTLYSISPLSFFLRSWKTRMPKVLEGIRHFMLSSCPAKNELARLKI